MWFVAPLLLSVSVHSVNGFATSSNPAVHRVGDCAKTANKKLPTGSFVPVKVEEGSTSLHVGVSYGPPVIENRNEKLSLLMQRGNRNYNYGAMPVSSYFDVDPVFSTVSIAYPKESQYDAGKLNIKRALAGSTAVVCGILLLKQLLAVGLPTFLSKIPYFYSAYPLKASIATCSINSATADFISQFKSLKQQNKALWKLKVNQSLSSITYGAFCLGIGSNLVYTKLLPALFPGSGITAMLSSALLDNLIFAPMLWLPSAYAVKAMFFESITLKGAMQSYAKDVREGLLSKYWTVWIPAQLFTFSVVPKHLRVASTAAFSFVWFLILTSITSNKKKA